MASSTESLSRDRGRRQPARPVDGIAAYPSWLERLRAVLGLGVVSIVIALLIAVAVGVVVGGLAMLVDYAISR